MNTIAYRKLGYPIRYCNSSFIILHELKNNITVSQYEDIIEFHGRLNHNLSKKLPGWILFAWLMTLFISVVSNCER